MDKKKLTDKQEMFCKEYMVDFNATQAAIRAGYSENTAYSIAEQNLRKLEIQERLSELKDKRSNKIELTAERVIQEIKTLAFSNIPDYFRQIGTSGKIYVLTMKQFEEMPEEATRAISSIDQIVSKDGDVTYRIRLWDKSKNLELLCKHLGITADTLNVKIDNPEMIKKVAEQIMEKEKDGGK